MQTQHEPRHNRTTRFVLGGALVLVVGALVVAIFREQINEFLLSNNSTIQIPAVPSVADTISLVDPETTAAETKGLSWTVAIPALMLLMYGYWVGSSMVAFVLVGSGSPAEGFAVGAALLAVGWLVVSLVSWWLTGSTLVFPVLVAAVVVGCIVGAATMVIKGRQDQKKLDEMFDKFEQLGKHTEAGGKDDVLDEKTRAAFVQELVTGEQILSDAEAADVKGAMRLSGISEDEIEAMIHAANAEIRLGEAMAAWENHMTNATTGRLKTNIGPQAHKKLVDTLVINYTLDTTLAGRFRKRVLGAMMRSGGMG